MRSTRNETRHTGRPRRRVHYMARALSRQCYNAFGRIMPDELIALSPLDGRYANETDALQEYFSEFAIIRGRVAAEVAYLMALSKDAGLLRPLTPSETDQLHAL